MFLKEYESVSQFTKPCILLKHVNIHTSIFMRNITNVTFYNNIYIESFKKIKYISGRIAFKKYHLPSLI